METQRAVVNQMIEAFGHGPDALPDCGDVDNDELLEKQQRLVEELGDMTRLLRESIRNDGAIDAAERAGLQTEARKLYQLAHELVSVAVRVYGRD